MNTLLNFRTIKNIFLLILVIAPLVFKMMYLDSILYSLTRTKFFVAAQVFANDAIIYSTIIILFYLSYLIKTTYIISIILRGLAFLVLSLYVVDLLVITNFNTHLVITDAIKYASYSLKYIQQIYNGEEYIFLIIVIVTVGFVVSFVFSRYKIRNNLIHGYSIVMIL